MQGCTIVPLFGIQNHDQKTLFANNKILLVLVWNWKMEMPNFVNAYQIFNFFVFFQSQNGIDCVLLVLWLICTELALSCYPLVKG